MAMLFMDGFDSQDMSSKWIQSGTINVQSATRFNSGSAFSTGNSNAYLQKQFTPSAQVFVGFALKMVLIQRVVLSLNGDTMTVAHISVRIEASGAVSLLRGATVLAATAAGIIPNDQWTYIEVSSTIADTGGVASVRVNGVEVLSFTGDTRNAGVSTNIDSITLGNIGSAWIINFDDVYVCNSLGSVSNTFLGDVRIQTLRPNSPGTHTDLLPIGSANNWENVDEVPTSIADYNASNTIGQADTYGLQNLAAGTTAVYGVQTNVTAYKSDAGTRLIKHRVISGATTSNGPTLALGASATSSQEVHTVDPNTSAAWTVGGVNSAEAGVEIA